MVFRPPYRAALHPVATSYVAVSAAPSPRDAYPPGEIGLRGMTHRHIGAYVGEASCRVAASDNSIDSNIVQVMGPKAHGEISYRASANSNCSVPL
jgi:hypothetical protein